MMTYKMGWTNEMISEGVGSCRVLDAWIMKSCPFFILLLSYFKSLIFVAKTTSLDYSNNPRTKATVNALMSIKWTKMLYSIFYLFGKHQSSKCFLNLTPIP